jgi:hypothetical protein
MEALIDTLREVIDRTRDGVSEGLRGGAIRGASESALLDFMVLAGELGRLHDAILIESIGEVARRSDTPERDLRLTTRMGCHDVSELVQRLTRLAPASASRLQRAAQAVTIPESILGEALPPVLPAMRAALIDGEVGLDGLLAVAGPLAGLGDRVGRDLVLTADAVLAAEARGAGPEGAPPASADVLHVQAQVWATVLDQDGAEPRESRQLRRRSAVLGTPGEDGLVPIRGLLLPEVAAQYQRIIDAVCSPRIDADGPVHFRPTDHPEPTMPPEIRTRAQQQHDALATALFVAASSELLPTIGGAAPTLVVSVRAEDMINGTGWAQLEGCDEPVGIGAARHGGCAGTVQRVWFDDNGRIEWLGTEDRVFNRRQRRAIALRDGGCIIPGCGVPAGWSEIHHVIEHANGGPTHTDNGVMLCWFHHRFLDLHGWEIRMNRGVPQVRAPLWFDSTRQWRAVTTSRPRLRDVVDVRY